MKRRDFLKSSGALVVAFSSAGATDLFGQGRFDGPGTPQLDAWLAIAADGSVTAYTGKVELGHGLFTAQTQLVAEELSVPLSRVKLIQGDTAVSPDQGTTSGSQSHPVNFNEGGARAGVRHRARGAARRWRRRGLASRPISCSCATASSAFATAAARALRAAVSRTASSSADASSTWPSTRTRNERTRPSGR